MGIRPSWEGIDAEQAAQLEIAIRDGLATEPNSRIVPISDLT